MLSEQTIRESKRTIRELTAAEASIVSGAARLGQPFPEPIPNPSPTFPGA